MKPVKNKDMSNAISVKIFYAKGIRVSLKNKTFKEAMILIWQSPAFSDFEPLKIVFRSTGKTLYADKPAFHSFLDGFLTQQELIELTQCDDLYRNTNDILTDDHFIIDKGYLWKANGKEVTLIDDDNYATAQLNKLLFEIVE
jgi:hypothetical protein